MKIPASTALAVVAVCLLIANYAPAGHADEAEDRTCAKMDQEAQKVGENFVDSCNYWCLSNKENKDDYVNKYYPDGTKCKWGGTLPSLCIKEACHHPESDTYKNYVSKKSGGNQVPPGRKSGETPKAPTGEEEPPEKPDNTDEVPEQDEEQEEEEEDEDEAGEEKEEEDEEEGGEGEEEEIEERGEKEKENNEED